MEFASLWRSFGSEVTLVEGAADVVPLEDPDSSKALGRALARRGIAVRVNAALAGVTPARTGSGSTRRTAQRSTATKC